MIEEALVPLLMYHAGRLYRLVNGLKIYSFTEFHKEHMIENILCEPDRFSQDSPYCLPEGAYAYT
jgi:hypothetical protein